MKGWMLSALILMIGACHTIGDETGSEVVTLQELQHHRWVLVSIDDLTLEEYAAGLGFTGNSDLRKTPELDFGEQGHVSGNTGCNQIQGEAGVENGELILSPLASTRMACPGFAGELELRLNQLYAEPLDAVLVDDSLVLTDGDTRLIYRLKDWVQ